ncbi:MAG TPA: serine hydrolase domain-containing protein [Rhizomicrobium sp.]|nr:serine hydrolase domain-containing protein [Rhizomicrobium sp.]
MLRDRRSFLALSAAALIAPRAYAGTGRNWRRDFEAFVKDGLAMTNTPGLSVAIVRGGKAVFAQGFGYADVEHARRATADTVFQIASVSKTVTATAMMMLWQDGRFKLDDPVAPLLDFPLKHPKFPDAPVTFRHLFTHTSGISDEVYGDLDFTGQTPPPLRDFLAAYLAPGGRWYSADKSWSTAKPGTAWSYSNVAVALLGYLAGRVGPDPLDVVTQKRIFAPLGMHNTAWRYEGIADNDLAQPYAFENARYKRIAHQTYPDWPAGLLCTSSNDFAKFLRIYTEGGRVDGRTYLTQDALKAMLTPDPVVMDSRHPDHKQGLIWQLFERNGAHLAGHHGGDPGAASVAVFDAERHVAVLVFANIDDNRAFRPFQNEVTFRLLDRPNSA